jgi:PqqD family protein of HPr-rel-A system
MADPAYVAASPDALLVADLDGLTAIYHRPSGQTHIVTEPVPEILAELVEAKTVPALLAQLGLTDTDRAALEARLAELLVIGLVAKA